MSGYAACTRTGRPHSESPAGDPYPRCEGSPAGAWATAALLVPGPPRLAPPRSPDPGHGRDELFRGELGQEELA